MLSEMELPIRLFKRCAYVSGSACHGFSGVNVPRTLATQWFGPTYTLLHRYKFISKDFARVFGLKTCMGVLSGELD